VANNPFFADATTEAAINALTALCNSGFIEVYSGTQPTDANTAIGSQVLLATLDLSATAFGTATASGSAGSRVVTAAANSITSGNAVATGTAAWFRCYKSNGTSVVFDGSVGTSGADLNLSSTSIVSGEPVSITSFSVSESE
jgi:hypothetical protein